MEKKLCGRCNREIGGENVFAELSGEILCPGCLRAQAELAKANGDAALAEKCYGMLCRLCPDVWEYGLYSAYYGRVTKDGEALQEHI